MCVVVSAQAAEFALQSRSCHDLDKTVPVPGYVDTCGGGHPQQVSVQRDGEVWVLVRKCDFQPVPPHGQVLPETDGASTQHQLNGLGPGVGLGPAGIVLHQYLEAGRARAVLRQHVLARPLEVKGPAVESIVMWVSEHRTNPRLFRTNGAASIPVDGFPHGTALDWGTLLPPTFHHSLLTDTE